MIRAAFSMLELVFVIVAMAVLGVALLPSNDRVEIGEAAHNLARYIRLTQHYAMMNDVFSNNANWHRARWNIRFVDTGNNYCGVFFMIGSDADLSNALGATPGLFTEAEAAIDPLTGKAVFSTAGQCQNQYNGGASMDVLLGKNYDIQTITFSAGCGGNQYIPFDHLGRPYRSFAGGSTDALMTNDCSITITDGQAKTAVVRISAESGFVKVMQIDGVNLP